MKNTSFGNSSYSCWSYRRSPLPKKVCASIRAVVGENMKHKVKVTVIEKNCTRNCSIMRGWTNDEKMMTACCNVGSFENKKQRVLDLYSVADMHIPYTERIKKRSSEILLVLQIRTFDNLHIAIAEEANADVLLTTDDKFEKTAEKLELKTRVVDPLRFLKGGNLNVGC